MHCVNTNLTILNALTVTKLEIFKIKLTQSSLIKIISPYEDFSTLKSNYI